MSPELLHVDALACPAFGELSFTVGRGEWIRLAGGSQKACRALVDEIYGLSPEPSHSVLWWGKALTESDEEGRLSIAAKVSCADREGAFLLNLRIWENLLLPLRHHHIPLDTDCTETEILAAFESAGITEADAGRILQGRTDDLSDLEIAVCILIRAHLTHPELIVGERLFDGINPDGLDALASLITWIASRNPGLALLTIGDPSATLSRLNLSPWPHPKNLKWKETSWQNS
jgi:ABC-type transporter Mla maintaining outer membrane lipid asymmetry ATPase subunit MlaF